MKQTHTQAHSGNSYELSKINKESTKAQQTIVKGTALVQINRLTS